MEAISVKSHGGPRKASNDQTELLRAGSRVRSPYVLVGITRVTCERRDRAVQFKSER